MAEWTKEAGKGGHCIPSPTCLGCLQGYGSGARRPAFGLGSGTASCVTSGKSLTSLGLRVLICKVGLIIILPHED